MTLRCCPAGSNDLSEPEIAVIFRPPFFLTWIYPGLTWRIPTHGKDIYLTFDDGPMPGQTEFVLEALEKANGRGTFFCIGDNVKKYPELFKKIAANGHSIGNHTFNHIKGWGCSVPDYVENTRLCEEEIAKQRVTPWNNTQMALFRPPYGRIKWGQIRALQHYRIIMWDVLTHDYAKNISPEKCLRGSIRATRPGSIVVFHDSVKAERNLKYVLPAFLDHFTGLGYSFKAISNS
jgi:peptidoglycan/xylan/chitin deacetylase (PgdA/CDA1 family)